MCLIVDANVSHLVFCTSRGRDAAPIWRWLLRDGAIVYGGRLASELARNGTARTLLRELNRSGKAVLVASSAVAAEEVAVASLGLCESDDPHVIALARASGARVLYTHDRALMNDFRNPGLVAPKGSIYQRAKHARLLRHRRGCRRPPR